LDGQGKGDGDASELPVFQEKECHGHASNKVHDELAGMEHVWREDAGPLHVHRPVRRERDWLHDGDVVHGRRCEGDGADALEVLEDEPDVVGVLAFEEVVDAQVAAAKARVFEVRKHARDVLGRTHLL